MSEVILCKFRKIDRNLLDSLIRDYIYFSHPIQLNDPFDCKIKITKSLNCAIKLSKGKSKDKLSQLNSAQTFFDNLNEKLSNSGIFSCSYNKNNASLREPLLWAHYADRHKGICLVYNIPEEYILSNSMGGAPVDYHNNPLTNYFLKWGKTSNRIDADKFIVKLIRKYLTIKGKSWKYENEYRLIRNNAGEFQLDKSLLKFVCYGLNTPDKDRKLINSLLKKGGYEVEYYEMVRIDNDFGIRERKI